jgi:ABC-type antimicrobial peptide transport system permease subunit
VPVSFVIRAATEPAALLPSVRAAVARVDPLLPLRNAQPLDTFLGDSVAPERFRTSVLGILAALGLVLAVLGIYAVTYRGVVERRHEFAVRMALGAGRPQVLRLVLGDVLRDVALGAGLGVGAGWLLTTALTRAVTSVSATDAFTTTGVVATLVAAALLAALVPSLRILRVAPADALAAR